ncbi:cache domain-containing protein [Bacteroidota bacterium]
MTLRNKITLGSIIIILLSYIVVAVVVSIYVNKVFLDQVQIRIRHDLYSAHQIYDDYIERAEQLLQAVSIRRRMAAPLEEEIEGDLGKVFQGIYKNSGMDILTLVDLNGKVLYRAHNPGSKGDDVSDNPIIEKVLQHWEPVGGTVVLNADMLAKEGKELSERASIQFLPTPKARPIIKTSEDRGMFIAAAIPFFSLYDDQKLGILLGGYLLNRNDEIVDRIKEEVFDDPSYKHRDVGTATIFFDDLRIATNVLLKTNERAIGSRLSNEVYEHVIQKGQIWSDRAFVVNDWYITSYEPLLDVNGGTIGSLYVGVLEAPYKQPQRILILFILLMLICTALSAFLLTFIYMKRMLRPIDNIVLMCKKLMKGNLHARSMVRPSGEMGLLCSTIDQMADSIEKFEENLQKETQLQIGQSEKLAAIGRLAAGVAHEINNPLTSIMNFAHLLKQKETNDPEDLRDISIIIDETNRVRKIVRELLDFARQSPANEESFSINDILRQLVALIVKQKEFRAIRFIENYEENLPFLYADKNQIQQVFLNLLLNSAESIAHEGTISLYTQDKKDFCIISIVDTGCGIASEEINKIFDPFYTTKPVGKGTGLGLSVSYGIVKQYGGEIHCDSKVDTGSTFSVTLPYQYTVDNQSE